MIKLSVVTLCVLSALAAPRAQQPLPQPEAELPAFAPYENFGASIAMDGDRLVVGADGQSGGTLPGNAYVYERVGGAWTHTFTWQPPTVDDNDDFARFVAISGDVIVASASGDPIDDGSFYVLEWNGAAWVQTAHETAPPGEPSDGSFGSGVAVSGQRLLANNRGTGRVLVYDKLGGTWTHTAVLTTSVPLGSHMGDAIALDGDRAVATELPGFAVTPVGLAHVFDFDGVAWTETALLKAKPLQLSDYFGSSVAVSGDRLVVGAPGTIDAGDTVGAVHEYVLEGGDWTHVARYLPAATALDSFGYAVALQGGRLLVGEPGNNWPHGRAYVYEDDGAGFQLRARFRSLPAATSEGLAVALSGDVAAVTAGDPVAGRRVTIFDLADDTWSDLGGAKAGGKGLPALYGYGPLETGSACALLLTDALGFAPVVYFVALGPGSPHPFKGGTLQAFPPLLTVFLTTPPNDILKGNQMTLPFTMPAGAQGLELVLQAAVRDTQATFTVALSNALLLDVP